MENARSTKTDGEVEILPKKPVQVYEVWRKDTTYCSTSPFTRDKWGCCIVGPHEFRISTLLELPFKISLRNGLPKYAFKICGQRKVSGIQNH